MSGLSNNSSGAVLDLTWVNEAPIRYVPPDQVAAKVRRFKELLVHWGSTEATESQPSVSALRDDVPSRNPLSAKRTGAAHFIADLVEKHGIRNDRPTYEYFVGGEPVALMTLFLRNDGTMEIKDLVTHPGSMDGGGVMVEFALNRITYYNDQLGQEVFDPGILVLESYNDDSTAAYEALGFGQSGKRMGLNANESPKWELVGRQWKLVGRVGNKFRA